MQFPFNISLWTNLDMCDHDHSVSWSELAIIIKPVQNQPLQTG